MTMPHIPAREIIGYKMSGRADAPRKVGESIGEDYWQWRKLAVALPRQGPSSLALIPRQAFFCLLMVCSAGALAQAVSITVTPEDQQVKRGAAPRFEVQVRAVERARIMDVATRTDIRERLLRPRVSGPGEIDDIPVRLSELRPSGEGDYLVLEKGNSISFSSDGAPLVLDKLAPGKYTILFRYKPDWPSTAVRSNAVTFRVVD